VRSPRRPDTAVVAVIEIRRGAVATSGTYFRGEHIRGSAARSLAGVTIVGPQLGTADALATAVFADQAESLDWLGAFPGYGVMVVTTTGLLRWTANLEGLIVVPASPGGSEGSDVESAPG
jgi:thiamine biosynthesis lipoprotein ApbE